MEEIKKKKRKRFIVTFLFIIMNNNILWKFEIFLINISVLMAARLRGKIMNLGFRKGLVLQ